MVHLIVFLLRNNSPQTIALPPKAVLALLQVASEVYKHSAQSENGEGFSIDLSAANLTPAQAENKPDSYAGRASQGDTSSDVICVFQGQHRPS